MEHLTMVTIRHKSRERLRVPSCAGVCLVCWICFVWRVFVDGGDRRTKIKGLQLYQVLGKQRGTRTSDTHRVVFNLMASSVF
jgi:hypothetical protein